MAWNLPTTMADGAGAGAGFQPQGNRPSFGSKMAGGGGGKGPAGNAVQAYNNPMPTQAQQQFNPGLAMGGNFGSSFSQPMQQSGYTLQQGPGHQLTGGFMPSPNINGNPHPTMGLMAALGLLGNK